MKVDKNPPQFTPAATDSEVPPEPREICVEDVHKAFASRIVLAGVDLEVRRSDVLAIVGGSGCGKTVLLNLILGQLTPERGRILVADHTQADGPLRDVSQLGDTELDEVHRHWGVVFQRNALFSGTVYENIELWLREVKELQDEEILEIAKNALGSVGLPTDEDFLRRPSEALSGGMAKRLAVARAVSMDPLVMFYDEPTTGLDPQSSAQIHDLIFETHLRRSTDRSPRTTLIITHDKDLLSRIQPRTVMLHEGRIFFDGPFAAFQAARSPIIRPYFDLMPVLHSRDAMSSAPH